MSKRYSGKSFKDSSVKKKPKLSLKEKRKLKKDKQKKAKLILNFENYSSQLWVFLSFNILLNMYKSQDLWVTISETSQL